MKREFLFGFILLVVSSTSTAGSMYKWKDADGNVHFTQKPPPPTAESVDKTEIKDSENAVKSNWSAGMQNNARGFMNKAGVRRVWIDRDGREVQSQNRY